MQTHPHRSERSTGPGDVAAAVAAAAAAYNAGRHDETKRLASAILRAAPDQADALYLLAAVEQSAGRADAALVLLERLLRSGRRPRPVLAARAACLASLGRHGEAAAMQAELCAADPTHASLHNDLGVALHLAGRPEEALGAYARALALAPGLADAHANRGIALKALGRLAEADEAFAGALARAPGHPAARYSRALTALTLGRFAEGWGLYLHRHGVDRARAPLPGRPLPHDLRGRRLLVLRDQGLGDEVFFLRFAALAAGRGAEVSWEAHPRLASILARLPFLARVTPEGAAPPAADAVLSAGDLPYLLEAEETPAPVRLRVDPARAAAVPDPGPRPWTGVTWRAGAPGPEKLGKAVPPEALGRAMAGLPGTVVVLQRDPSAAELAAFRSGLGRPAPDMSAANADLESMLALLDRLDDYVAVSNTNLHLRAGLGRTCRVLVPNPPEFRWLVAGGGSPWFPGFSLYRQPLDGCWQVPLGALAKALHS